MNELAKKTLASQYANSPVICGLISSLADAISADKFADEFRSIILSVKSAQGIGLDIWGEIVGVSRKTTVLDLDRECFGFAPSYNGFNTAPFYSGYSGGLELSDDVYRRLVLGKAAKNILKCTAPNINQLLKIIFPAKSYFLITGHMTASYVFEFPLTAVDKYIVYDSGILPRPCGVDISIVEQQTEVFGFAETDANFDNGSFS